MLNVLRVQFPTDPPICGCEITPYVLVRRPDNSILADDGSEENTIDGFYLQSRWYRSLGDKRTPMCSVHRGEPAQLQCILCVKAGVPEAKSYHCSTDCFQAAWRTHRTLHLRSQANGARENGHEDGNTAPEGSTQISTPPRFNSSASSFNGNSNNVLYGPRTPEVSGIQWVEIGHSRTYTPTEDDVGHMLKYECTPCDANTNVPHSSRGNSLVTGRVIQAPQPIPRRMINVATMENSDAALSESSFTVMSYNVLADLYANTEMYGYCPSWALSWSYRKHNLLQELLSYQADILCLQEVQSDHFDDFFAPELLKRGYTAVYKKKTAEVYTGTAYAIDGCATFFRRDRFALVKKYEVEFNKAALSLSEALGQASSKKAALNRLLKDNVALIVVLEALEPPDPEAAVAGKRQLICVANTHIHANPELKDVKLWQVHTLLKGLEKIAASADIPMLVCGDFNSIPGSAPHSLLATGRVDAAHPELATDPLGILRPASKLHHQLPLVSAYSSFAKSNSPSIPESQRRIMDPNRQEPLFTNYTKDFIGTLDYIFYTADSLLPVALLELVEEEQLAKDTGMPSPSWSSDHIALLAEFKYKRLRR
eukprot:jgi/Chlat1/4489/Chrsp29S04432